MAGGLPKTPARRQRARGVMPVAATGPTTIPLGIRRSHGPRARQAIEPKSAGGAALRLRRRAAGDGRCSLTPFDAPPKEPAPECTAEHRGSRDDDGEVGAACDGPIFIANRQRREDRGGDEVTRRRKLSDAHSTDPVLNAHQACADPVERATSSQCRRFPGERELNHAVPARTSSAPSDSGHPERPISTLFATGREDFSKARW